MISIRSGKGLGDSLYLQGIVRHLVERGKNVEACTPWPDVFRPLWKKIKLSPWRRESISRVAHYIMRKEVADTDQFRDCCISAGINDPIPFRLDWSPVNEQLLKTIRLPNMPVVAVQLPRLPMDRLDGFGAEILPDCNTIQRAIDLLRGRAFIVQIGKGKPLYQFRGINLDLANKTSVSEMIDVVWGSSAVLGYCSFVAPLAESLEKPLLMVWSSKGLRSKEKFIRLLTPKKIFNRVTSRAVIDDCDESTLAGGIDALFEQVRMSVEV